MQQMIKRYFWIALLAFGLESSWGFALLGPFPYNTYERLLLAGLPPVTEGADRGQSILQGTRPQPEPIFSRLHAH